jgi:hypothetical protein
MYLESDYKYSELAIALEDYERGGMIKCYIPSLMSFINSDSVRTTTKRLSTTNIKNKDITLLGINQYTSCNYIELLAPNNIEYDENSKGKKGDKFILTFVGGDINQCKIISKYE